MTSTHTTTRINLADLKHIQLRSEKTGEIYSQTSVITELLNQKNLFIHHEILAPGRRASAPHSHSHREEVIFVTKGTPTAHVGDQTITMKSGDFVAFSPGKDIKHFIFNASETVAEFLVIASNPTDDQVSF